MKLCNQEIDSTQWHKLSKIIENMVTGNTPWMSKAIELIDGSTFCAINRTGTSSAAASQSALMFMEAAHTPASALLGGDQYGPLEM